MKDIKQLQIPDDSAWERFSIRKYLPWWFKSFLTGVKNLWRWFPIIWNNRDWDQWYIFEILQFKLIQQRAELVGANRHMDVWQVNRDLTLCINLIERIKEDYYALEYLDYDPEWITESETDLIRAQTITGKTLNDYFKKYPNSYKRVCKIGFEKYTNDGDRVKAMALSKYNQEKCQRLLFKILNERINTFWD